MPEQDESPVQGPVCRLLVASAAATPQMSLVGDSHPPLRLFMGTTATVTSSTRTEMPSRSVVLDPLRKLAAITPFVGNQLPSQESKRTDRPVLVPFSGFPLPVAV